MKLPMIALAAAGLALATSASANLVLNGDFSANAGLGQVGSVGSPLADWYAPSPNNAFLFQASTADVPGEGTDGVWFWGPDSGVPNGYAGPPNGDTFIVGDDGYDGATAIDQTVNSLVVGKSYAVSFWWASAQQACCSGSSMNSWQVSLGAQTQQTPYADMASEGFTPWTSTTLTFTATSSSEVLSFLSVSTQNVPPFALLSGVSMDPVPEPGSWLLIPLGLGLAGVGLRRKTGAA